MSYGRNPHYIYPSGDGVCFATEGDKTISDAAMNAWLYKMLLLNRRGELQKRLAAGRDEWLKNYMVLGGGYAIPREPNEDDAEFVITREWILSQEDNLVRGLIGEWR